MSPRDKHPKNVSTNPAAPAPTAPKSGTTAPKPPPIPAPEPPDVITGG